MLTLLSIIIDAGHLLIVMFGVLDYDHSRGRRLQSRVFDARDVTHVERVVIEW